MRLNIYLCLSLLVIFFFHAFKNPQTLDDIPYYVDAFYESRNVSWGRVIDMGYETFKTETGFALVIKTISSLFSFDQILFVLTSAFILFAVYHSIKQYSPIFWVSVFVFLTDSFPQSLFVLRAFVAISIYLLAFPFINVNTYFTLLEGTAGYLHQDIADDITPFTRKSYTAFRP